MSDQNEQSQLTVLCETLEHELAKTHITYKKPHKLIVMSKLKQLTKIAFWIAYELEDGNKVAAGMGVPKFVNGLNKITKYALKHGMLEMTPHLHCRKNRGGPFFKPGNEGYYTDYRLATILEQEEDPDEILYSLLVSWAKATTPAIAPEHAQP